MPGRLLLGRMLLLAALLFFSTPLAAAHQGPTPPEPELEERLLLPALQDGRLRAAPEAALSPDASGQGRDGYDDLFIGLSLEDIGSGPGMIVDAGIIQAIYGSPSGLTSLGNQVWSQDEPGVLDSAALSEYFGSELASGDFNGDYHIDLAVGIANALVSGGARGGAVHLFYGTADGLTAAGNQVFNWVGSPGALAPGDFNRDGFTDLALGAPSATVGTVAQAGHVVVFPGSPDGLDVIRGLIWDQDSSTMQDNVEADDHFGAALTAADFNRDSYIDLAIGVPGEALGPLDNLGAVSILFGSPAGLAAAGNQIWFQGQGGIQGVAEADDSFGGVLAAGDFNGDHYADLAVSAFGEDIGAIGGAGAVNLLYGSAAGLTAAGNQLFFQGNAGLAGAPGNSERFGFSLAAGDFNADGFSDLTIGVPFENSPTQIGAGGMHVLYGAETGLSTAGSQYWDESSAGVQDDPGNESFAYTLASGNFNGDAFTDLAVTTHQEQLPPGILAAGAVNVLFGSPIGLDSGGAQFWHQDSPDIQDQAELGDSFGHALASSACPTCTRLVFLPLAVR